MKILYFSLIIIIVCNFDLKSQTPVAEIRNMTKKYENKEFDAYTYRKLANIWREISHKYTYPLIPFDSLTNDFRYKFIFEFDSLNKNIIYNRILEYMSINQDYLSNVIDYQDYDLGKMILKVRNLASNENGISIYYVCTYRITIINEKTRIEIFNIGIESIYDIYNYGDNVFTNYVKDSSLEELFPITNAHHKYWENYVKILSGLDRKIKDTCLDLVTYIKNYNQDYSF